MANVIRELVTKLSFKVDTTGMAKANKSMAAIGQKMTSVGRSLAFGLTLPIVGATAGILKLAGDFEYSMNRVRVLTGATGQDFNRLREQAKHLGATTAFSASQAAEAMGFLAQAGFDADEIYAAMPATLNLAAAAQQDLATTADQMSNIMQGFGMAASESGRASDVLALAASSSNTNVSQLAEAMSYAAPVANMMGLSLEQTAAAMGFMGNAGIQASMAGTSLRQSLLSTVRKTPDAIAALEALGVSLEESVEGGGKQARNFIHVLSDLQKAGAGTEELNAIFGTRGIAGMGAILQQTTPELERFIGELENASGTAAKQAAVQMEGFKGGMLRLKSALEGVAIAIGDSGLLEFFTKLVNRVAGFVQRLANADEGLLRMITTIGTVLAFLAPILIVLGTLIKLIAVINVLVVTNPVVLIIAGIIAAIVLIGALVFKFRRQIADFIIFSLSMWQLLYGKIFDVIPGVFEFIGRGFANMVNGIIGGVNWIIEAINLIPGVEIPLIEFEAKADEVAGKMRAVGQATADGINSAIEATKRGLDTFGNTKMPGLGGVMTPLTGGAARPTAGITPGGGAGTSSKTLTVKSNINVAVPPGTTKEQQDILRQTAAVAVNDQWERILRHAETANTVVE